MALDTYNNFVLAIKDQMAGTTMTTANIDDCVVLFEADASSELFRQRLAETSTILIPSNPPVLNVSGAADNGSGLIRLTVSSTTTLTTGQELNVSQVEGTTEANGRWIITVIDGFNVDLQGSVFANAYTSGGVAQALAGQCSLPTDYMGWRRVTWTGTPVTELQYVHPSILTIEFPTFFPLTAVDPPRCFTIEGSTLKIQPVDTTPLEFDYYAKTAAVGSSLNWLFTNFVNIYWNGTLAEVYKYQKDYQQAGIYSQERDSIYKGIKAQRFREEGQLAIRLHGSSYGQTP